jgi:hypothetical protein
MKMARFVQEMQERATRELLALSATGSRMEKAYTKCGRLEHGSRARRWRLSVDLSALREATHLGEIGAARPAQLPERRLCGLISPPALPD